MLKLNRGEKNAIHTIIEQNGLDPSRFSWGKRNSKFNTVQSGYVDVADDAESINYLHNDDVFYFTFETGNFDKFISSLYPYSNGEEYVAASTWNGVLSNFAGWLALVKAEIEEPDLWKTPFTQPGRASRIDYHKDRPFTDTERRQLKDSLKKIQRKLEALPNFDSERVAKLEEAFGYLEQKLDSETLFDWKNIAMGVLVTIYAEPWLSPFAHEFRDAVVQHLMPFLNQLLALPS